MNIISKFEALHRRTKQNRWMGYFTVFNRVALAAGFLPSGYVKIVGERFTDLHNNHPMGHYLEALHMTGYYYTFIGIMQMTAAILLLIPRTATLGVLIYSPIILNICILSHSVCFIGSLVSSPLMVLSCIYLLCWDYDKLKYILPLKHQKHHESIPKGEKVSNRFPIVFFAASFAGVAGLVMVISNAYNIEPFNTLPDCRSQCPDSSNTEACEDFCDCIHNKGKPYHICRDEYNNLVTNNKK